MSDRAAVDVEDLLRVVLILVAAWLILEIVGEVLGLFTRLLGPLQPLLGVVVIALILLWLFDRI